MTRPLHSRSKSVPASAPSRRRRRAGTQSTIQTLETRTVLSSTSVLSPVVEASLEDSDLDGRANRFNNAPFTGFLSQVNGQEDRAIAEFDLGALTDLDSVTLDFELAVNNSNGGGTRSFDVLIYQADGQATLADFSVPGTRVGTVGLLVSGSRDQYQIDVTNAVRSIVNNGGSFIGLRVDAVNDSAPSILTTSTLTVTGTETPTNTPPSVGNQVLDASEDLASGSNIGRIVATDPDAGQNLSYTITGGNADGRFTIDANTGDLALASGAVLDFETDRQHVLTIRVTDDGTPRLSDSATVTVRVGDVNDTTPVITGGQEFTVREDTLGGTILGRIQSFDPDIAGGPNDFQILSGNESGLFAINDTTGNLVLMAEGVLDVDVQSSYELTVTLSDGLNTSAPQTITVIVEAAPSSTTLQPVVVASIHDAGADGTGNRFNTAPFEGLLRQQSGLREDHAIAEFDLTDLGNVTGGVVEFNLAINNHGGPTNRVYNVSLYAADGVATLDDYSGPDLFVGQVSLGTARIRDFSLDIASRLATLQAQGATKIGVRVDPATDSFPVLLRNTVLKVNLPPTLDEPAPITIDADAGTQTVALTGISAGGSEDQQLRIAATTTDDNLLTDVQVSGIDDAGTAELTFAPVSTASGDGTITVSVTDAGIDGVFGTADDNTTVRALSVTVNPAEEQSLNFVVEPWDNTISIGRQSYFSVAILSTDTFDATTEVDPSSLNLEIGGVGLDPLRWRRGRVFSFNYDVDRDGDRDLLVWFRVSSRLQTGNDVNVTLTGSLRDGNGFTSESTVDIERYRRRYGRRR